ncbi:hypothetical protein [Aliiroseovarius sp. 2305UL8-7]|uniref:hypothetical protein n=1 Tax=Aliiroseovarius conchicola TaxID=3121637 RepID=UPI0035278BDF
MTLRITIACPESRIADANQFALCLGYSSADVQTFQGAMWEDADGARYALASLLASAHFPQVATSELLAPTHAPNADIASATRAQMALEVWTPEMPGPFPTLTPEKLVAVIGLDAGLAIPLLGLTPVPVED